MSQRPPQDIPIPSESIHAIQVSQLAGLTQSAALESLIQQNIDLTTRLNINLRRVADMERVIQNLSAQNQNFETQKDAFREELQVLHKRFQVQESKLLTFRIEKENAEKAYANAVLDQKQLKDKLELEKFRAQASEKRIQKFRTKIHSYIRPLFKSLSADSELLPQVQSDLQLYKRYRSRVRKFIKPWARDLKFQLKSYKDRCERLEVKTTELSRRIEELLNHLGTRTEQFDSDQKKLVDFHETRWSEQNASLEKLQADFDSLTLRYKATQESKQNIEEENMTIHNRAIASERRLEEVEARFQEDLGKLQADLARYEGMWTEASQKLEMTAVQWEAAQRLNSTFTDDLKKEREQNEELKTRIRHMKIHEIAQQSVRNAGPLLEANPQVPQQIVEETSISKLESLFAEIQSGDMGQSDPFV